jgi:HlyD family secretion protein
MRSLLLLLVLPLVLLAVVGALWAARPDPGPTWKRVPLTRGTVMRDAVAVGRIEPVFEIPVTATTGGVVTRVFVKLGQRVDVGDPLFEVRPVLSEAQKLAARRALLAAREAEVGAVELQTGSNLLGKAMWLLQGGASLDRMRAGAARARSSAEEQLTLLLEGQVEVEDTVLDWVVRAKNTGHVLSFDAEVGMPVVPASSYGPGTELCVLGDLDRPVFRGTVDELDAGVLHKGDPARVTLGALPGRTLTGSLTEISLRGERRDNAVSFPVELTVERPESLTLRSGYSAIARIEVARVDDALLVPERLVRFAAGEAFVDVAGPDDEPLERSVSLGLGDGLMVQVLAGLGEDDVLLERVD